MKEKAMQIKRKVMTAVLALALSSGVLTACGGAATKTAADASLPAGSERSESSPFGTSAKETMPDRNAQSAGTAGSAAAGQPEPSELAEPDVAFKSFESGPESQQKIAALLVRMQESVAGLKSFRIRTVNQFSRESGDFEQVEDAEYILSPQQKAKGQTTMTVNGQEAKSEFYREDVGSEYLNYSNENGAWTKVVWPEFLRVNPLQMSTDYLQSVAAQDKRFLDLRSEKTELDGVLCAEIAYAFSSTPSASSATSAAQEQAADFSGESVFYIALDSARVVRIRTESKIQSPEEVLSTTVTEFSDFNAVADFSIPDEARNAKTLEELLAGLLPEASSNTQGSGN